MARAATRLKPPIRGTRPGAGGPRPGVQPSGGWSSPLGDDTPLEASSNLDTPPPASAAATYEPDPLAGPDGGDRGRKLAAFWRRQVDAVDDAQFAWLKRGRRIVDRYRDERNRAALRDDEGVRRYSSLYANVETLHPIIYGREPLPVVGRRFNDRDPAGRGAATILERALRDELEPSGMDAAVDAAVRDYLLPGRGEAWVRYEPEFGPGLSLPTDAGLDEADDGTDSITGVDASGAEGDGTDAEVAGEDDPSEVKLSETGSRVVRESTPVDYVPWDDFYMFPARARKWAEVTAVGKRCYLSRDQLIERFGEEIGKAIPLQQERDGSGKRRSGRTSAASSALSEDEESKGEVVEIWCRSDETVYWIADGYEWLADRRDDPLRLDEFFPCPKPLVANATNDTMIPVPDYAQYQDQALQIDELTQRIAMLSRACKVAGVYNAAQKDIVRLLDESVENQLIPVDGWAAFAEKGGVAGQLAFLPIKDIISTLNELLGVRAKIIADMDRITGIPDVLRGTTDGRETMGGQKLRGNYANVRTARRQKLVAQFCRDVVRIQAQIMARHYSVQSLLEASSAMQDEALGGDTTLVPIDGGLKPLPSPLPSPWTPTPAPMPQLGAQGGLPPRMGLPAGGAPPTMPPPLPLGAPAIPSPSAGGAGVPPALAAPPPAGVPGAAPLGALPPGMPMPGIPSGLPAPPALNGIVMPPPPMGGMGASNIPGIGLPAVPGLAPMPSQQVMVPRGLLVVIAAIKLLRDEKMRGFRIDIEVDSTIAGDQEQEKASAVEFISSVTKFLQAAQPVAAATPEAVPMLGALLQFGVRRFRVGRDLEATIEDFCDRMEKAAAARAANPAPVQDPKSAAHAVELQRTQIETSGELQRQTLENQGDAEEAKALMARTQMTVQAEAASNDVKRMQLQVELLREQNRARELELPAHAASQPQSMGTLQ